MWKGITLVLFGISAFVVGTWYFVSAVPERDASPVSAVTPGEKQEEAATASTPSLSADAEIAGTAPNTPSASNSATAGDWRLTRANFDMIKKGMTEDQVKVLLGNPTETTIKTDPKPGQARLLKTLQWIQLKPAVKIEVEFIDGKAGDKKTNLPPGPPPRKPEAEYTGSFGLTRAKYDSIENGMTHDEVIAILGQPIEDWTEKGTINGTRPYQKGKLI